jgi:hypothetical protein
MSYAPTPGSWAAKAIAHLQKVAPQSLRPAELAAAIGYEGLASNLSNALLKPAITTGLVVVHRNEGERHVWLGLKPPERQQRQRKVTQPPPPPAGSQLPRVASVFDLGRALAAQAGEPTQRS